MPRAGFKSVTVKAHIYDEFYDLWAKNKKYYESKGIMSFSGFITQLLNKGLEVDDVE